MADGGPVGGPLCEAPRCVAPDGRGSPCNAAIQPPEGGMQGGHVAINHDLSLTHSLSLMLALINGYRKHGVAMCQDQLS